MPYSNLERFLSSTTPKVRCQIMPKVELIWDRYFISDWRLLEKDSIEYFSLEDLWECYNEWSVYGVGSPIMNGGETVVQYYTPYISAIQIFLNKDFPLSGVREDCDGESEEGNSWGSESDGKKLSRSSSNESEKVWDMENTGNGVEGYWPGRDRLGDLYFEYFENDVPFGRVPFKEKIDAFSKKYPGLKTFNSMDLSPASWMAVAWYPIYHIPSSRNAKELYASFLTYHTLSSLFQDDNDIDKTEAEEKCHSIRLHPFGLATYRMQPKVWLNPETSDHERFSTLMCASDSWLKQLRVQHHDYNFFMSHSI